MSRYACLVCNNCQRHIWLGKTVRDKQGKVSYFSIADQVTSNDHTTVRAVFKMLAECIGHELIVLEEGDPRYNQVTEHSLRSELTLVMVFPLKIISVIGKGNIKI